MARTIPVIISFLTRLLGLGRSEAKFNSTELGKKLRLQGLEIADIQAPNGEIIACAKQGSVLVPVNKVAIFAMGKVNKYPEKELRRLQDRKQKDRKNFDANPESERRLEEIKILRDNYERSQEMLESIRKIGFEDSVDDISTIIEHLLAVGERVDVQSRVKHPSKLDGPSGKMKVLSTWKFLPDGTKYLSTLNIIPKKENKP